MKTSHISRLIIVLSLLLNVDIMASTISGNISYTGTSTGKVLVIVFTDTTFQTNPTAYIQLDAPGSFTTPEISDGTYYLVAIMSKSLDNILLTDPWGYYGTPEMISPVVLSGTARREQ
jgi:hypothetical protein